ncbi:MAG TPA: hypothetical protein VM734_09670 [Kofleriaceae bacterium]|nr:hypothetical protein [Kofleriaceae bacterium]
MSYLARGLARCSLVAVAAGAAVTLFAGSAAAQSGEAPPLPPRVGWELGFGVYAGEINCENERGNFCDGVTEAGGFDLHASYFFSPKLGLTVDLWPMFHTEDDWTFTHTVAVVGLKWRPAPIFTFTAGVGSAQARLRYEGIVNLDAETETVPAVLFAAGLDLVRGKSFALEVQARAGIGFYEEDDTGNGEADVVGRNVGVGAALTFF